ncbi:MAG: hypothetical protein Q8O00_09260 [Holophaga sp.]|nr:hypothetical protein [Holophaga sp.]
MVNRTHHLEEPDNIRAVFQRLCRNQGRIQVQFGLRKQSFPVIAEDPTQISVGISSLERDQWGLKTQSRVQFNIEDRGRKFEAITELEAFESRHGLECCHFGMPRLLSCLDEWSLADFSPDRPLPCTYTCNRVDIRDGLIIAFGNDGVLLATRNPNGAKTQSLRIKSETLLECVLDRETKVLLPCIADHLEDGYSGLRLQENADVETMKVYRAWLSEKIWAQQERDKQEFSKEGVRALRKDEIAPLRPGLQARLILARDPLVLVIAEGDAFPNRITESLGRKFGIAALDYVQGQVRPTLATLGTGDWGAVRLILVHQRLRVGSGLELTHQLVENEACPLPILVAGTEEDVTLKRNRAIAAGAVDFISVDPFHVLRVMKAIDDTLKMFA